MSDTQDLRVEPAAPSGAVAAARPAVHARGTTDAPVPQHVDSEPVAASTEGQLRSAYAQFVIDSDTHDVVVRIHDAATDRVLQELPSPEVQAMMRSMTAYAKLLERRRAAVQAAGV